ERCRGRAAAADCFAAAAACDAIDSAAHLVVVCGLLQGWAHHSLVLPEYISLGAALASTCAAVGGEVSSSRAAVLKGEIVTAMTAEKMAAGKVAEAAVLGAAGVAAAAVEATAAEEVSAAAAGMVRGAGAAETQMVEVSAVGSTTAPTGGRTLAPSDAKAADDASAGHDSSGSGNSGRERRPQ
ncbi:unnamed protein product, partial [Phaeothamnion confervicola]